MSYADQKMSSGRMTAIVIVALLHALLGYAFVTGLAYNVVKKVSEDLKTFDVTEEPPPSAQDEFSYDDVNDAEQAIDDSLENIGGREAPDVPIDADERAEQNEQRTAPTNAP